MKMSILSRRIIRARCFATASYFVLYALNAGGNIRAL
jgi:hypothetical protein